MKFLKGEKGQALPLVMIAITIGALVIPSFLGNVGTSLIGSRTFMQEMNTQYTCDAGVEHAIWNLAYNGLTDNITYGGDMVNYLLPESINGLSANITVSNGWETIASEDFESGGWTGGTGWLDTWNYSGNATVTTSGAPYEGSYHLRLLANTGNVSRSVDLSGEVNVHLQFQAKVDAFEAGDEALCRISSNGTDWTTVYTWDDGDSDNLYHGYDIDLTPYDLSSQFYIAFESNMSSVWDYFYVDNIEVKWIYAEYTILASDDFESGDWSGGTGWLADWYHEGDATVNTTGTPYAGNYHLRLSDSTAYVSRTVDLSTETNVWLQLQVKVDAFEVGDEVLCTVSSNGTDWTTVYTWDDGNSDNQYHSYDIDLTPYGLSDEFYIAFESSMSSIWDYFYIDNPTVTVMRGYGISSKAGDSVAKAVVEISGSTANVTAWYIK
jgi:hypothetical protein